MAKKQTGRSGDSDPESYWESQTWATDGSEEQWMRHDVLSPNASAPAGSAHGTGQTNMPVSVTLRLW